MNALRPGDHIEIEEYVTFDEPDLSSYLSLSREEITALLDKSIMKEENFYSDIRDRMKIWQEMASETRRLNRILEYLNTPETKHTANQWQSNENREEISNKVYKMTCEIWEDIKYDRETKQRVPVAWYVTWGLYLNSTKRGFNIRLTGQNRKRYTDKTAAVKYLDGRKKAYAHLFTEISPPIPREHAYCFKVNGLLLPGYTIEGE